MAIRQTRVFVPHSETLDWAETLLGRVFRPLVAELAPSLRWFWFSRYVCQIGAQGEDRGDCNLDMIPDEFKRPLSPQTQPAHRSLRFRFEIKDEDLAALEARLQELLRLYGYAISDVRHYDEVGDTGSQRFLGVENRQPGRDAKRARLVTQLYHAISQLVIDSLVGPNPANRYRIERNDLQQNPNASTFESLHHLFCNITQVPVSVLFSTGGQMQLLGTFWGQPRGQRQLTINGQTTIEVYVQY